jgi:DNA excision repair protein ERCC-4
MAAKEEKKFTIIRDTREQDGCGWNFRASANCHGMEKAKLDVGDYAIKGYEHKVVIERKTLGDLWGTMGNGYDRFIREWERAKDHKMKFLIIEATLQEVNGGYPYSKLPPENVIAKLMSLMVKHNVHVIFAGRIDKAQNFARVLMAKMFKYCEEGII